MADNAPAASPPLPIASGGRAPSSVLPLFAWLTLQMLPLFAAGFRVPLSARFPAPEEQMALYELLFVQVTWSALFFPSLFPTVVAGVLGVASVPVMILLAAILASRGADR